jgi:hypothetical protein
MIEEGLIDLQERCMTWFAPVVKKKHKFHLNLTEYDQYTARIVLEVKENK